MSNLRKLVTGVICAISMIHLGTCSVYDDGTVENKGDGTYILVK